MPSHLAQELIDEEVSEKLFCGHCDMEIAKVIDPWGYDYGYHHVAATARRPDGRFSVLCSNGRTEAEPWGSGQKYPPLVSVALAIFGAAGLWIIIASLVLFVAACIGGTQ